MKMFNFWIAFHPDDFLMAAQLMISEHGFSWWLYTKLCIGYGDPIHSVLYPDRKWNYHLIIKTRISVGNICDQIVLFP